MYPIRFRLVSILLLLAAIWLAACASGQGKQEDVKPGVGLANPASVYCQELGFKEETRENELGQHGVCIFPDGSECDSWDFLAGRCGQENSYCVQEGFELKALEESNIATCLYPDGSTCDEFSYFQGDCKPGEQMP